MKKPTNKKHQYTHFDRSTGMRWRFEGVRPISELADQVMDEVFNQTKKKKGQKQ